MSTPAVQVNALSVDMEEWFCVSNFEHAIPRGDWNHLESRIEGSTRRLLDLFQQHQVRATFFVLGWIAERHPDLIRTIAGRGHEVASHGYAHRLAYSLSPDEFRDDVARSLEILEDCTGQRCLGYRAPSFSLRTDLAWAWRILAGLGLRYDSSLFPIVHGRYGDPGAPRFPFVLRSEGAEILEFPMSTARILGRQLPVAGGGYLRLYPLMLTRWAIRELNRQGRPAIVYVHPWEIDPDQPRPQVSRLVLLRHRVGIRSLYCKLGALLGSFRFAPVRDVLATAIINGA